MKRSVIERAVKVNFGSMELVDWEPTMEAFLLIRAGYNTEKDEVKVCNRHNTYLENEWYRRKLKLVENYLKIYG
jgi:hypothetical protein